MRLSRKASINGAIVVLAIGTGLAMSMRPWREYRRQTAETKRLVTEMRQSEKTRADLLAQEAHARSSLGREEMARSLGYVLPGEKPADKP